LHYYLLENVSAFFDECLITFTKSAEIQTAKPQYMIVIDLTFIIELL